METFLRTWLEWPSVAAFIVRHTWAWPLGETFHFFGIILLIGGVGLFDLRLLGVAKGLPVAAVKRLLPWGVTGFILCALTGFMFVTGIRANIPSSPYRRDQKQSVAAIEALVHCVRRTEPARLLPGGNRQGGGHASRGRGCASAGEGHRGCVTLLLARRDLFRPSDSRSALGSVSVTTINAEFAEAAETTPDPAPRSGGRRCDRSWLLNKSVLSACSACSAFPVFSSSELPTQPRRPTNCPSVSPGSSRSPGPSSGACASRASVPAVCSPRRTPTGRRLDPRCRRRRRPDHRLRRVRGHLR